MERHKRTVSRPTDENATKRACVPCEKGDVILSFVMTEPHIHMFRKAINTMKDMSIFITLKTIGENLLRLCVVDHFACGAMYVDIPVSEHRRPHVWINLASEHLFKLSSALNSLKQNISITIHQDNMASFMKANSQQKQSVLPSIVFENMAPLSNQFHAIRTADYYMFEMVSQDLLHCLTSLSIGSPIVTAWFRSCGKLTIVNKHDYGVTQIDKRMRSSHFTSSPECDNDNCDEDCHTIMHNTFVIKFTKQLVNPLVNSSRKSCYLGIPRLPNQPLTVKFLLAGNVFQYYLMFPLSHALKHVTDEQHPQASVQMNTHN